MPRALQLICRRLLLPVLAMATLACHPEIKRFTVSPHEICPGTTVTTDWKVVGGRPSLVSDPPIQPLAPRKYAPTITTSFILTVRPLIGKPKSQDVPASVYTGTASAPQADDGISFDTKCQGGRVVGTATRPFDEWDARLVVVTVESDEDREVVVEHDGKTATLTVQSNATAVFDGTKLGGTWTASTPLRAGETCVGDAPPQSINVLSLTTHVRCEG